MRCLLQCILFLNWKRIHTMKLFLKDKTMNNGKNCISYCVDRCWCHTMLVFDCWGFVRLHKIGHQYSCHQLVASASDNEKRFNNLKYNGDKFQFSNKYWLHFLRFKEYSSFHFNYLKCNEIQANLCNIFLQLNSYSAD